MLLSTILGSLAVALAVAAIPIYQWPSLVPRLGIRFLYHARRIPVGGRRRRVRAGARGCP